MTEEQPRYAVGEIVQATVDFTAQQYSGYGRIAVEKGDEFEISVIRGDGDLQARRFEHRGLSRVMILPKAKVRRPFRKLGEVPPDGIPLEDPRIAYIFEDAQRVAKRLGLCRDFDAVVEMLGAPGKERRFNVNLGEEDGVQITATVTARSKRLAELQIRSKMAIEPERRLAITVSS